MQKERADLDLNSGNRGFLAGKTDAPSSVAKTTRESKVVEIEVFPLIKSLKKENPVSQTKKFEPIEPASGENKGSKSISAVAVVSAPRWGFCEVVSPLAGAWPTAILFWPLRGACQIAPTRLVLLASVSVWFQWIFHWSEPRMWPG